MDWIVTTGATEEEALEAALDQLSVTYDDVEYEVLKAPRRALLGFGTRRAHIRSRVRPVAVPAKRDRRPARANKKKKAKNKGAEAGGKSNTQKQQRAPGRRPSENRNRMRSTNPLKHQEKRTGVATDEKEAEVSTTRKRTLKADATQKAASNVRSRTINEKPPSQEPTTARRTRKIDH